jgi:hypothetical protein
MQRAMIDDADLIDDARTRCLCDVGRPDYLAATAIAADGSSHLLLAQVDAIGAESVTYDASCSTVAHEQLGPLPLDVRPAHHYRPAHPSLRPAHKNGCPVSHTGRPSR